MEVFTSGVLHLAAHIPKSSHSPYHDLGFSFSWFSLSLLRGITSKLVQKPPKLCLICAAPGWDQHLWSSSSPFLTQQTRIRPSLHLLASSWHWELRGISDSLRFTKQAVLHHASQSQWSLLFSGLHKQDFFKAEALLYILYDPHRGGSLFPGSPQHI